MMRTNEMITVAEAQQIIQSQIKNYGIESVPLESAVGRVLAEELLADRDLPPFNRVAMDGIAIQFGAFEKGIRTFTIKATQAAGEIPVNISTENECIEIMTGAALPETLDTIIPYEEVEIKDGLAIVKEAVITKGQNVHNKGDDKKREDVVASAPHIISPALIGIAASIGRKMLSVKKLPRAVIISTGDELVEVNETPTPYQIRRSNSYTIKAALHQYHLHADMIHIRDDAEMTRREISRSLEAYDVILLSGGVSMGKFDYVPRVLDELTVEKYFHKVQQRPGKPFWFGAHANGALVFAFPGNPVSAFTCLHRYFVPWLKMSLEIPGQSEYAILDQSITFDRPLQYFLQVTLQINEAGQLRATPVAGRGSGDFANLLEADAFMELPAKKSTFKRGEVYKVWMCKL